MALQGRCSAHRKKGRRGELGGSSEATWILAAVQLGFDPSACKSKHFCPIIPDGRKYSQMGESCCWGSRQPEQEAPDLKPDWGGGQGGSVCGGVEGGPGPGPGRHGWSVLPASYEADSVLFDP